MTNELFGVSFVSLRRGWLSFSCQSVSTFVGRKMGFCPFQMHDGSPHPSGVAAIQEYSALGVWSILTGTLTVPVKLVQCLRA